MLGQAAFEVGGRALLLGNRKSRALLAYLLLGETGSETRERLLGLLWSEADPVRARASLRQAVYEVRSALEAAGSAAFSSDNLVVTVNPRLVDTDVRQLQAESGAGRVHALLVTRQRIADSLLEDLASVDPTFESWVTARREVLARRLTKDLEGLLDRAGAGAAKSLSEALLNLDPTHEKAARALMRALVAEGNVGSALEVYKRLWDLLDAEYDTEPSEETQRLVAVIKMGEGSPPPDPNAAAGPPRTTVSVQPRIVVTGEPPAAVGARPITSQRIVLAVGDFDIAGDVQGHGHVFPAFRRELIAQLVRFREWIVRDLSFGAGSAVPNSSEYLIEATAMVQKGAARLVVTLKNVETGDYLWSERLPIDLGAWYESMHEIVRRLSSQLNIYLSVGRMASILRQPSANLRAYDMWLKAQTRLFHWRPDEGHAAEELLKQIIAEVPDFAPAYASLASFSGNVHFYHPGFMRALERHRAARAFAEQAVRLDPIDSRAHLALGWADSYLSQFEEAVAQHDLALDLNDSDPWTLTSTALSNAFFGSREQADKLCGRAFGVSPSPSPSQWGYKGQIEFMRGEYDAAATSMEKSTSLHFGGWRAASLAFSGRKREANTALNDFFAKARERWYGTGGGSPEEIT